MTFLDGMQEFSIAMCLTATALNLCLMPRLRRMTREMRDLNGQLKTKCAELEELAQRGLANLSALEAEKSAFRDFVRSHSFVGEWPQPPVKH